VFVSHITYVDFKEHVMWDASKIRIICEKVQLQVFYSVYMKKLVKQLTNID
jgi:hypothetical protein